MKNRNAIQYLSYLVIYGALILIGFKFEEHLQIKAEENFLITPYFYYSLFFPVLLGALFAIPKAKQSYQKNKKVGINWGKLLVFGIPSLLVLLFPAYYFTILTWGKLTPFATLLYGNENLHFLSGLILGYIIVDSIEYTTDREDRNHRKEEKNGS
ncbi:hypothetical protein [Alkalihalobacillus sp. AL-G]|uniref:hypothetical protein n=1 Tax=Alkalihalobacillus sp. AL-G TaxID=2926399 RepID=UPI00272A314F|nr:hypothetical protein [Alkalihalobacillus sp. AL-G]WLD94831.1 hypothetical protein MOJ78_08110 [Alkalihalobacillus sp. AL-G]